MNTFTVESFTTGTRQTVQAADWQSALKSSEGEQFTVIKLPDGRYLACCNENSAFPVPGGHFADSPEAAAAAIREHYRTILAAEAH